MAQSGNSHPKIAMLDSSPFMQPAPQTSTVVRFGVFEADIEACELRKNGVKVKIQDLPFRALKLFLGRPNEVLSRDQFRQALWPENVFVDFDHGISSAINRLRDAVGDSADNPVFIETVERRGYRWIAPIHHPAPPSLPSGPVLVTSDLPPQAAIPPSPPRNWRWSLIFPAGVFLLAVWSFWPSYRAASAGAAQPPDVSRQTLAPSRHSPNPEAQQFYLQGRFYWEKRTPDGLNKAVDYFTQAIVRDPNYAPAYVGLADCYNLLREYTLMSASEAYPRALAAAQRAVELDNQSSEAHASLAFALFWGSWNAHEAEREFRRAIDLNPNNSVAHHWYATYLSAVGRHQEALAEIERAQSLAPGSKSILADKGDLLWLAGHRDEGIALLKQLETAEPGFISPHRYLKCVYFATGDYALYLQEWKKEAVLLRDNSSLKLVDTAEKGFAAAGTQGILQNVHTLQKRLYDRGLQSPYSLAETDSVLGNKQEALAYLKIAYDRHDENVVRVEGDAAFANLRDEPAYKDLVARLGFSTRN